MSKKTDLENAEDILNDSLAFLGGKQVLSEDIIRYGPLELTVAPKEGKANTLLADHLFSPALFLAERIERDLIPLGNRTVIELGAGAALPSLLMSTLPNPPSLVVVTDYPDDVIMSNLKRNIAKNQTLVNGSCIVKCYGYEWGTDTGFLIDSLPFPNLGTPGFDIVVLSDLLHFRDSHDVLITSLTSLLSRSDSSRVHAAAGTYTPTQVCDSFLSKAQHAGLHFDEITTENDWMGNFCVSGLDKQALAVRKAACRYWVGRWV